jgi:hypothetical protein
MRSVAGLALFVVSFVASNNADAASIEELFHQFSLFGIWATDCKTPPTPINPHVSITMPSAGLVLEDHDLGPNYAVNRYSVLSADKISATNLSVNVIFQPGTEIEERQKLVFAVRENTRRTIFNQTDGGAVRVKNGIALARGSKTPVLHKCEEIGVTSSDLLAE